MGTMSYSNLRDNLAKVWDIDCAMNLPSLWPVMWPDKPSVYYSPKGQSTSCLNG